MSHLKSPTLKKLSAIADDLYEVFEAEGYTIDEALGANRAFGRRSRRSQSSLGRDLAIDTIAVGASRESMQVIERLGGTELRVFEGAEIHHYRLLKGGWSSDGQWRIISNSRSALTVDDLNGLFREQCHVFSWSIAEDNTVSEVITARVRDYVEGNPGHLVLDQLHVLGSGRTPGGTRGFIPTDDNLPGFEEDEGDGSAAGPA